MSDPYDCARCGGWGWEDDCGQAERPDNGCDGQHHWCAIHTIQPPPRMDCRDCAGAGNAPSATAAPTHQPAEETR